MNTSTELKQIDKDLHQTERNLINLTKWIVVLTFVMIVIGIIQLIVMWPKRTYCVDVTDKVQVCEPDYFPYDTNPASSTFKLDQQFGS